MLQLQKGKAQCNHFPLQQFLQPQNIYLFQMQIHPYIPIQKIALRNRILSLLESDLSRFINKPVIIGMYVYTMVQPKIQEKVLESGEFRITVKFKRVVRVSQNPRSFVVVLENVLREIMVKKNYNILGKTHKYFQMRKKVQHYSVHVYSGYRIDFCRSQSTFQLRIDCTKKIVSNQTALDAIDNCYKLYRMKDRDQKRKLIKDNMVGRTVLANYGKYRFYKIKDIYFQNLEFVRLEDNRPLVQYYEEKYGISVKNLNQPLLLISNKKFDRQNKKCFLVPQLCFMVGFPPDLEEVKEKNILAAMNFQPEQIRNQANKIVKQLVSQQNQEWQNLQKLGIILTNRQMPTVNYNKFPRPILQLGNSYNVQRGLQTLFNIAGRPIYKGTNSVKCTILYFNRIDIGLLRENLEKYSRNIGVEVVEWTVFDIGEFSNNRAVSQIEVAVSKACEEFKPNVVLLVLPNQLKSYYRKLKKICLIDNKIVSQFVCQSLLSNRNNIMLFSKILLQILSKRGNILWNPKQLLQPSPPKKIMLIGFQTSKLNTDTILATCSTQDNTYTVKYSKFGVCSQYQNQSNRSMELLEIMVKNVLDCLEHFRKINSGLPSQIIFMSRLGSVSVGQRKFKEKFVAPLRKQVQEYYQGQEFSMTYLLLDTQDSSKFFLLENEHSKARNPEIGVFFDETIVCSNEFLMVTQSTPGVSTAPVRYKILDSDSKLRKNLVQELLFNQCFGYANYTGVVQVPAILMYAKKFAKFISQAPFEEKLEEHLEEVPYFL